MTAIAVLVVDDRRGFRDCACRLCSSHDRADLDRLVPAAWPRASYRRTSSRRVVAEDSVLLGEGMVRLLEEQGFEVVGKAGDAEDLLRKVAAHKPDLGVVDVRVSPTCLRSG